MKKRRWIWLLVWILTLVGISFYGGTVSYSLFFGITLLPVISFVYLLCVYFRFKIYQEVESRTMVCGQRIPYYFVLRNEDYFGFAGIEVHTFSDFSYVENVSEDQEYELMPGESFTYHTSLVCKYRGEYEVGVKEIIVTDFFRIFRLKYPVPGTIKAIVRPKMVPILALTSLPELTAAPIQNQGQERPDVVVRNYADGDPLKRVHWKLSAKEQKLKVRTDIGEETRGLTLLLDTERCSKKPVDYLPLENKMLEIMLSLGMFLAQRKKQFRTFWYSQGRLWEKETVSMKGFEDFSSEISAVAFGEASFTEMLQELVERNRLQESEAVIAIVHEINDKILFLTKELAEKNVFVLLYVVTDGSVEAYLKESSPRRKIVAVPVEAELEGVL